MNSFPDLPVDVARHILEIAALHHRKSACQLIYVSKEVRKWIDPILYHTVVLKNSHAQDLFIQSCCYRLARDADFYARNVKVLYIQGTTTYPRVSFILWYCAGVDILALRVWVPEKKIRFPAFINVIKARRLSVRNENSSLLECIAPNLTHLHLSHDSNVVNGIDWARLFQLWPHLTHILLDIIGAHVRDWNKELLGEGTVSKFRDILKAAPPSFKALILEVLEHGSSHKTFSEGELEAVRFGQAGGFDVAAANLIKAISDKRFVFIVPNNRFTYVSGLVCYEYTHNPLLDWGYRVIGELDAYEMADRHLSAVGL